MGMTLELRAKKIFTELDFICERISFERTSILGKTSGWWLRPREKTDQIAFFLHGTGNDALFPQISLFIKLLSHGLQVLSIDLDGHGIHSTTELDPAHLSQCLEDLMSQGLYLHEKSKIHLIGQSLGGGVILDFLAKHQDSRFCSASLISTPIHLNQINSFPYKELGGLFRACLLRQFPLYGPYHLVPALGAFKRKSYPIRIAHHAHQDASSFSYVHTIARALDGMMLRDKAAKVRVPVLLCYGERDQIACSSHGRILHHIMPDSRLVLLNGETHFTTLFAKLTEESIIHWIEQWSLHQNETS